MALKGLNLFSNKFASSRSSMTCTYKCNNACFGECGNKSDNAYFGDLMSRRTALRAGGLTVVSVGGATALAACSPADGTAASSSSSSSSSSGSSAETSSADVELTSAEGMQFEPVAPNTDDQVTVPEGYEKSVLIAWGDPMFEGAPEFDINNQTADAQRQQFGFNNDFAGLFDHPDDENRMIYVCSHEYTTEPQMHPGYDPDNPTEEEFLIGIAAHGQSILEVSKVEGTGELKSEFGPLNRRITGDTPVTFSGPAAGSDMLKTSADPEGTTVLGTLNNCAGGITPWGTYLSGEENIDQYFANAAGLTGRALEDAERFGVGEEDTQRKWERFDDRFDMAKEPNEFLRFGYVVEIDPFDPESTPVKRTLLGRFKHEAGNVHVTDDNKVVVYSGDDERFEYIYKFVAAQDYIEGDKAHNMTLLDSGTLYVATLEGNSPQEEIDGSGELPEDGAFDGTGVWHPLVTVDQNGQAESHVENFSPEEVCVYTRMAADTVGATKMDRPEDFETNPVTGLTYVALTNNDYRGATGEDAESNEEDPMEWAPIRENKNGLVMEIDDDYTGTEFTWNLLLVCGDPEEAYTYFGGFDKSKVSPISCPDNLAFDTHGHLWISTDGNALGTHDGLYAVNTEGENRGELKCFLTVPIDAETCGPVITDERVMVNIQHPGEGDDSTVENPSSHWPGGGDSKPRPAVSVVWKADGGPIGVTA